MGWGAAGKGSITERPSPYGGAGKGAGGSSDPDIWVRGLPAHAQDKDLKNHMQTAGKITACQVVKPGLGFVRYASMVDAMKAKQMLNGSTMQGGDQALQVDDWTGKKPDCVAGKGSGGSGPSPFVPTKPAWTPPAEKPAWQTHSGPDKSDNGDAMAKMMLPLMGMMAMMGQMGGGGGKGGWNNKYDWSNKTPKPIDESGGVLGEYKGTIKSFVDKKWYGFIECAEIKAAGYQDVFLFGDQKKNYQVGNIVKFTAVLNKEGKPVAKDLKSGLK